MDKWWMVLPLSTLFADETGPVSCFPFHHSRDFSTEFRFKQSTYETIDLCPHTPNSARCGCTIRPEMRSALCYLPLRANPPAAVLHSRPSALKSVFAERTQQPVQNKERPSHFSEESSPVSDNDRSRSAPGFQAPSVSVCSITVRL